MCFSYNLLGGISGGNQHPCVNYANLRSTPQDPHPMPRKRAALVLQKNARLHPCRGVRFAKKKTIALPFPQRLATLPCRSPSAAAPTGLNSTAPLPVALRRTESNSSRGGWRHRPWTAVARSSRRLQVQRRLPSTAAPLELRRSSCRLQVRRLPPTAAPVELRQPKSVTLRRPG